MYAHRFRVAHDTNVEIQLQDETSESVTVKVVHAHVDEPSKCGAGRLLMCAYSTSHGERISCKATENDGSVRLSVIPGQDAEIRNGCPKAKRTHQDNEPECVEEEVVGWKT